MSHHCPLFDLYESKKLYLYLNLVNLELGSNRTTLKKIEITASIIFPLANSDAS